MKEDLTVKPPQNLEEILSQARGFMKMEEKKSYYLGSVRGRESHKKTSRRVERDRSIMRDSKFHIQRSKARDKVSLGRNEPHMIKPLRSYDPHDQVVSEVWHKPCPLTIPHSQLLAHLKGKEYMRWALKMQRNLAFHVKSKFCKFYNDHDHYTVDYSQLKAEIAQLLRQGHLKEFISEQGKAIVDKGKREDTSPPKIIYVGMYVYFLASGSSILMTCF